MAGALLAPYPAVLGDDHHLQWQAVLAGRGGGVKPDRLVFRFLKTGAHVCPFPRGRHPLGNYLCDQNHIYFQ